MSEAAVIGKVVTKPNDNAAFGDGKDAIKPSEISKHLKSHESGIGACTQATLLATCKRAFFYFKNDLGMSFAHIVYFGIVFAR